MNQPESYRQGVERAKAEKNIQQWFRTTDGFSHQQGLSNNNTRVLNPAASMLLQAWPGKPPAIIELGPGSGMAASGMHMVSPDSVIHTAGGLTPINPFWRFSQDIAFRENDISEKVRELMAAVNVKGSLNTTFDADELMRIQREYGVQIFDVLEQPYIHHQWVDDFPKYCTVESGAYDFVYETCGPNWHTQDEEIRQRTFDLLSPTGIVCGNGCLEFSDMEDILTIKLGNHTFSMKPDNFLARAMRESGAAVKNRFDPNKYDPNKVEALLRELMSKKRNNPDIAD